MDPQSVEGKQLLSIIERVELLESGKKQIAEDIKDVFSEAKGNGYDVPILKHIVKLRAKDASKRREEAEVLDLYMSALGMEA